MISTLIISQSSFLHKLFNPLELLQSPSVHGAIIPIILGIVFIETGLLFPLLPGDSLLFAGGLLAATGTINLISLLILVPIFAFAGDQLAYWIGRLAGHKLYDRPDSRWIKHEHLNKAHDFFERRGAIAIIVARFLPIIRTFSALIAGISRMDYRLFVLFDAIGAILWGDGITLLGYSLGHNRVLGPIITKNIDIICIIIVLITIAPAVIKGYQKYRTK